MRWYYSPPTQYNIETKENLQVLVFNIVCEVRGEIRQVKLYSRATVYLACVEKRQKCKFNPELLSMIVDIRE